MALVWKLDQSQVGPDGLISLYRGDDWRLIGKLVNRVGGVDQDVDSTNYAVSGFLPAAGGNLLYIPGGTLPAGNVVLLAGPVVTAFAQISTGGIAPYLVIADSLTKITTVPAMNADVVIIDRGYSY